MYSEDDLFVFDEFFSIDYIAGHLRHLVRLSQPSRCGAEVACPGCEHQLRSS
jgi:hypothetical protein